MTYDAYFEAVSEGDAAAAVAVLRDEMDRGAPPQRLVRDFVVRGQAEAGGLWLDGLWGWPRSRRRPPSPSRSWPS